MRRRGLVILCLLAVAGILYGSLMPFDFDQSDHHLRIKTRRFMQQWPLGEGRVSRGDLIANVALYVPLGVLLALAIRPRRTGARLATIPAAAAVGLGVSALVEYTQLFLVNRVSSPADLLMNTIGAALGALLGVTVVPPAWRSLLRRGRLTWREDPIVLLGLGLAALLVADALFPLLPSLDVGQFIRSFRRSALHPCDGWRMHPWHHWLVRRALPWGALAALLTCSRRDGSAFRPWRVAVWVVLLAAACELGKLFIISRVANVANVLVTVVAALAGSLLGRYLLNPAQPRRLLCLLAGGLLLYLTYLEWEPFTFAFQLEQARSKWPTGTEWLPLYHYAMGARPEDVRLFVRTVSLTAGAAWSLLNCCPKTARSLRAKVLLPVAGGLVLGMLLEAGQFALPRVPSVTDVLCMGLGGGLGGLLAHRKPIRGALQDEADPTTDAPPGA